MAGESGRVGQQRGEPLYPSVDGDMVDLDVTFDEQFFDLSVGQIEPQLPADRDNDHLRWKT
jgi:hypothetical protein